MDEAQHFDFVQYVARNELCGRGDEFISPEVISISVRENQWGWRPAGALSTTAFLDTAAWRTIPAELDDHDRDEWVRRILWRFNYEAMQPPSTIW